MSITHKASTNVSEMKFGVTRFDSGRVIISADGPALTCNFHFTMDEARAFLVILSDALADAHVRELAA